MQVYFHHLQKNLMGHSRGVKTVKKEYATMAASQKNAATAPAGMATGRVIKNNGLKIRKLMKRFRIIRGMVMGEVSRPANAYRAVAGTVARVTRWRTGRFFSLFKTASPGNLAAKRDCRERLVVC